jgi:hypothetical protein
LKDYGAVASIIQKTGITRWIIIAHLVSGKVFARQ